MCSMTPEVRHIVGNVSVNFNALMPGLNSNQKGHT